MHSLKSITFMIANEKEMWNSVDVHNKNGGYKLKSKTRQMP